MTAAPAFLADDPRFAAMIEALADGAPVERIDTHGAAVFLAGDRAYKIKRPVAFPYMDLSTPARRLAAAEAEVRLNRRTAPALYLGLAPVRDNGRSLSLGAVGDPVPDGGECVVVMVRFDQATLFDRLAQADGLTDGLVMGLAEEIAAFHAGAETIADRGGAAEMTWVAEENLDELLARTDVLDPATLGRLAARTRAALGRLAPVMDARLAQGFVRHCHGDLHLRNVCLVEGHPTIFDALEFNDALAVTDTMYDLAYMLMDLVHRGLRPSACLLLNRYLEMTEDDGGLALLPFFMSVRAAVRAKVSLSMAAVQHDAAASDGFVADARDYLALAAGCLEPVRPVIAAVGGLSGSGKSTVARALAPLLDPAPGAVVLRSDVIRKHLMGVDDLETLGAEGYRPEVSAQVYDRLIERSRAVAEAGFSAIADATFTREDGRAALAAAAAAAGVPFHGIWLDADRATLVARVAARTGDPSDADAAVVARQLDEDLGTIDWSRHDARQPARDTAASIAARIRGAT